MKNLFYLFGILIAFAGCDSTVTIEDPEKSSFIKFYGLDGDQTGKDFVVLPDGSMILFGTTRPTVPKNGSQWYVVRVNQKGTVVWEKEFGGKADDEARDIELTASGQLALVGNSYKPNGSERDVMVMLLTTDGALLDSALLPVLNTSGVDAGGDEDATSITESLDGFLIAGSSTFVGLTGKPSNGSLADPHDALIIRLNVNLDPYGSGWPLLTTVGFQADDVSQKIVQISSTVFYVFGYTNNPVDNVNPANYNYWVFVIGATGVPTTAQLYVGVPSAQEKATSFVTSPAGSVPGYVMGGLSENASGVTNFYAVKLATPLFLSPSDILFQTPLTINLGTALSGRTAVASSQNVGFFVLGEENGFDNNQNWVLTKINTDGSLAWNAPIVFGGEGMDDCGAVQELPDGRLAIIGTMRTGRPDAGEFKLTLIKTSSEGKFE